jgi:hypothetical protein
MRYLSFFLPLILISCSQGEIRQSIDETGYRTSGIEQFFLPELPAWANHSASGECFKKHSFQYLDFNKLGSVYQLTYPELLELQAQYNDRLESYFRSTTIRFLRPVEESAFFANTLENVKGGVRYFKLPQTVNKVDLIFLDRYIALGREDEIRKMSEAGKFDEAVPVIFSACLSRQDLNQWLVEKNLDQVGFYSLTAEWLSPYSEKLQMVPKIHLEIKKLLRPNVEVRPISPEKGQLSSEIVI